MKTWEIQIREEKRKSIIHKRVKLISLSLCYALKPLTIKKNIMGFLYLGQQRINNSLIQHNNFKGA